MTVKKCTKKRDARAELLFYLFNQLLFWRSCCRRRRSILKSIVSCSALFKAQSSTSPYVNGGSGFWNPRNFCLWNPESWASESRIQLKNPESHLESRIQVPLTNAGIEYLESGIRGVDSRIQDCLGFPYSGVINLIKKKRRTIAIKEHKIWKPNKKGNICERNWAECSGKAKTIMWKCIFACVNKNLLLVHPRNCPLVPVDDFPVSCGSYVYLLVISQSLDSILWYILFTFYYLVFALYFLVFALCLIKLHCSQPILRFKIFFFHVYYYDEKQVTFK